MPFYNATLPNGLQVIGETSPSAYSMALGFFVRTGSRDETASESGVSHFLEHMVFKGTPRRSSFDVNRDFARIGADNNAYTSEEMTVFHCAFLPEYMGPAIEVQADILRPSLRDEDFDTEKKVILEEIAMYEDRPNYCAYDRVRRLHFGTHKLGNSVLGTVASIGALRREQMRDYFSRRYAASNITVVGAGKFEWSQFLDLIARQCGDWSTGPVGRDGLVEAPGTCGFEVVTKEKTAQEHVFLVSSAPAADSPLHYAAGLLSMAVGDDSGSRLYWELVDPGLAESADTFYQDCDGAGAFFTSFNGEPDRTAENLELVRGVLFDVQRDGIRAEELEQARNKALSRLVRGNERPHGRLRKLGESWVYLKQYRSVDDDLSAYQAVTLKDVRAVLERYPLDRATTLALGPLTKLVGG
jgi:predicted Zn-dependent peptidase